MAGPWPDLFGVKPASSLYLASARRVVYIATWACVSGWTFWCWQLLEGLFPPCSLSDHMINVG